MSPSIFDENVPIVANDHLSIPRQTPQASKQCILDCIKTIRQAVAKGRIVIDDAGLVLEKYRKNLSGRGQPGVGDAFFKHLIDFQFNRKKVLRIVLRRDNDFDFEDFPRSEELKSFDNDDRIFVALALRAGAGSKIFNAVDSDYSHHADGLKAAGVTVVELCADCLK